MQFASELPLSPFKSKNIAPPFLREVTLMNSQLSTLTPFASLAAIAPAVKLAERLMNFERVTMRYPVLYTAVAYLEVMLAIVVELMAIKASLP